MNEKELSIAVNLLGGLVVAAGLYIAAQHIQIKVLTDSNNRKTNAFNHLRRMTVRLLEKIDHSDLMPIYEDLKTDVTILRMELKID